MKQARLIVVDKDYIGDTAIDNVIGYALDSYHADTEEMLTSGVRNDSYKHIIFPTHSKKKKRFLPRHIEISICCKNKLIGLTKSVKPIAIS